MSLIERFKNAENKTYLVLLVGLLVGTFGATSFSAPSNLLSYVSFVLLIAFFFSGLLKNNIIDSLSSLQFQLYDLIPLILLLVWLYGFARGVYAGNSNTLRNFAGMGVYLVYYVLVLEKINKFDLLRCVLVAAGVIASYMYACLIWDKLFSHIVYGHISFEYWDVRAYYSEAIMIIAVPIVLGMHRIFSIRPAAASAKHNLVNPKTFLLLYIYAFAFMQISFSKAAVVFYALALLGFILYYAVDIVQKLRRFHLKYSLLFILTFGVGAFPAMVTLAAYVPNLVTAGTQVSNWHLLGGKKAPSGNPDRKQVVEREQEDSRIRAQFLEQSQAEERRGMQAAELKGDLTVWGRGLGSTLSNGYKRDSGGYGFESNYLNLIHKFGVLALCIFVAYIFILYKIWRGLSQYRTRHFALGALSILVGLLMGFGNPVLMSPVMVCMQCIVLYWLRLEKHVVARLVNYPGKGDFAEEQKLKV